MGALNFTNLSYFSHILEEHYFVAFLTDITTTEDEKARQKESPESCSWAFSTQVVQGINLIKNGVDKKRLSNMMMQQQNH